MRDADDEPPIFDNELLIVPEAVIEDIADTEEEGVEVLVRDIPLNVIITEEVVVPVIS